MARWLIRAPAIRPLHAGDAAPLGDVIESSAQSDWAVVDVPGTPAEVAEALAAARRAGRIMDFQPEHTFLPAGVILDGIYPLAALGADFPIIGITPAWQDAVQGGRDVVLGIADTGMPDPRAHAAHYADVELVNVYGGADTHGHSTACVSRMVGPRGVLPACSVVKVAQALPNGQGSTTTVVQAIRALHQAGVDAINLSLGGPRDPVIEAEVRAVQAAGTPCVAAAGNDGWQAQPGSPASVAAYVVGATVFNGGQPASFSSGGCQWLLETGALPGEQVAVSNLDSGVQPANGTSFSAPVLTAVVGGLRRMGWA
jgi:hypothetical protein